MLLGAGPQSFATIGSRGRIHSTAASEAVASLDEVPLEIPDFQAYCGGQPPQFQNEAELECAKILDYYGVPWQYEPHTFVLEQDETGRTVEAITPDFFLPEQALVTRKNRKLRKLRKLYPEVKIKLFYERDFERIASRYGLRKAS